MTKLGTVLKVWKFGIREQQFRFGIITQARRYDIAERCPLTVRLLSDIAEMAPSDVLAIAAIVISIASFALSFYSAFQDRPRLKITSKFYPASEWGPAHIHVAMVNKGRRPVILRLLGGTDNEGHWGGKYLERENGGLRLGENERYEERVKREDAVLFDPENEDIMCETMWIEDSLGNRHVIPDSSKLISLLWS